MKTNATDLFRAAGDLQMQVSRMIQAALLNPSNANFLEVKAVRGKIDGLAVLLREITGVHAQGDRVRGATTILVAVGWMLDHYTKEFFKPVTYNIALVGSDSGGELPDTGYRFETPRAGSISRGIFEKAKEAALVEVVFHTGAVMGFLDSYLSPSQLSDLTTSRLVSLKFQTYFGDKTKTQMDEYWVLGENGGLMGRLYR